MRDVSSVSKAAAQVLTVRVHVRPQGEGADGILPDSEVVSNACC